MNTLRTVLAASVVLLLTLPASAHAGDIKFGVAQDYPASTVTYTGSASPGAVARFYRDGRADKNVDMVIANTGGGPVVLYGLGPGTFSTQRNIISNSDTDASVVEVGDFNRDRIPDIVTGSYGTSRMTVLLGRPDGGFTVGKQYPLRGIPTQFEISDFNRDRRLDIAVSAYAGGKVTILLGEGDGTFREVAPITASEVSLAMLSADFNKDGIPDLAVEDAVGSNALGGPPGAGEVHIMLGKGDGTFRLARSYPIGVLSEVIQYGDINEDGKKDLIAANVLITNDASLLYGRGGGRFAPEQRVRLGGPGSIDILDIRAADGSEGLQLVDFNDDGHLDMAVTQIISSRVLFFQGDGRGNFVLAGDYGTAGFPEDLISADLNRDGCLDVAVPGNMPPIGPADVGVARVSVLLNVSDGCRGRKRP